MGSNRWENHPNFLTQSDTNKLDVGRSMHLTDARSLPSPLSFGKGNSRNFKRTQSAAKDSQSQPEEGTYVVTRQSDGDSFRYQLSRKTTAAPSSSQTKKAARPRGSKLWELSNPLIINPESTYYSESSNAIFVSSVVGDEVQKDRQGWISKVSPQGKLLKAQWVKGLNAPHGMREKDGTLWVADIDQLVAINIKSARIISRTTIPGARFLNDVAIANDGRVFVSDTVNSQIYQYDRGRVTTFAKGKSIESPNGLLVEGERLIVAGWGQMDDPALFSTTVPGRVFHIDLASKRSSNGARKKTWITKTPLGNLDGIEQKTNGNFVVSDYVLGQVFFVNAKTGQHRTVLSNLEASADIGFIPQKDIVLVPNLVKSTVTAYQV